MTPEKEPTPSPVVPVKNAKMRSPKILRENWIVRASLIIGVISAVLLGGVAAAIHFLVSVVVDVRSQSLIDSRERLERRHANLQEDLRATEKARQQLADIRIPAADLVRLVQRFEAAAAAAGVNLALEAISEKEAPPTVPTTVRYDLRFQGTFENLVKALSNIHEIPELVRVIDIRIEPMTTDDTLMTNAQASVKIIAAVEDE